MIQLEKTNGSDELDTSIPFVKLEGEDLSLRRAGLHTPHIQISYSDGTQRTIGPNDDSKYVAYRAYLERTRNWPRFKKLY